jgi:hypothetical protein
MMQTRTAAEKLEENSCSITNVAVWNNINESIANVPIVSGVLQDYIKEIMGILYTVASAK